MKPRGPISMTWRHDWTGSRFVPRDGNVIVFGGCGPDSGLAGAAAVIMLVGSFFFTPTVSWAQVEEKFRTPALLQRHDVRHTESLDPAREAGDLASGIVAAACIIAG
jgi:hypothetical protein